MKKIVILTTISGFLQQFEMNDVTILQELGYEVHYASNFNNPIYDSKESFLKDQGIKLHQINIQKSPIHVIKNILAFIQFVRVLKNERISYIHCHNPMGGVFGRAAAIFVPNIFVLYTAHGLHFYKGAPLQNWLFYYPVEYILSHFTNRIITINEEDFKRASLFHLRKNGSLIKVPGVGVKTKSFFREEEQRDMIRTEQGVPKNAFYILSVGELNDNKNHKIVLEAISRLNDNNIFYGICGRGKIEADLLKSVRVLGLEKQVKLFGFRSDIPRMLSVADCFAFPSKREGLGMAALEAMSAGIPLITSDCRGTREYMRNGVNGFVCQTGTVQQYAQAICSLRDNPKLRGEMAQACMEVAKEFDISATDKIMREVYSSLPCD